MIQICVETLGSKCLSQSRAKIIQVVSELFQVKVIRFTHKVIYFHGLFYFPGGYFLVIGLLIQGGCATRWDRIDYLNGVAFSRVD